MVSSKLEDVLEEFVVNGTDDQRERQVAVDETAPEAVPVEIVRPRVEGSRAASGSSWFRDLMVSVVIAVFIILFLYQPVRVEGTSMLPMLEDQDRLFINKWVFHFEKIHHGDVVVFLFPQDQTKSYIKRVIGLPGDTVRIDHGTVIVNGVALKESYVPFRYQDDRSEPEMVIPKDEYFVMGDHRSISSDSRDFGPVDRKLIYGKAAFVYWPMDQAGVVR